MSTLEDRLAAALAARAEQVRPDDLTPATPPATVVPLRARVRPSVYAVVAAVAAAAVVVVVTIGGGAPREPDPAPPLPTPTPSPTSSPTPTTGPTAQVTSPPSVAPSPIQSQVPSAGPTENPGAGAVVRASTSGAGALTYGGSTTLPDGTKITLEGTPARGGMVEAGQARLVITSGGTSRGFVFDAGPAPELKTTPVLFNGEGPVGYLVSRPEGGDYLGYTLILDQGTELDALATKDEAQGAPPLPYSLGASGGGESGWDTFVSADGSALYTAYVTAGQPVGEPTLVRWGITGPAAGPQLTTTSLGTVCVDDPTNPTSYTPC